MQQLYKSNMHDEHKRVQIVWARYKLNAFTVEREYREGVSFVLHQVNCPGHPVNNAKSWEDCGENMEGYVCAKLAKQYPEECRKWVSSVTGETFQLPSPPARGSEPHLSQEPAPPRLAVMGGVGRRGGGGGGWIRLGGI